MKQPMIGKFRSTAVALCVGSLALSGPISAAAEQSQKKDDKSFTEKMEQWQNKMSDTFRDAWKSLRGEETKGSVSTASVDLREQEDCYTVRLNLPHCNLESVKITLADGALRIAAPAENNLGCYEQTLKLDGVATGADPKVERRQKDAMIIVTVPKASSKASVSPAVPWIHERADWDRDLLAEMEKMRREMNRVFRDAFEEFKLAPEHKGFFDEPRFGSSVDVQDDGDQYSVKAYLPERNMRNVNVTVEGQSLRIEAVETKEDKSQNLRNERKAAYSQILTLPAPVQAEKMKVEKKDEMLIVTLPKAK